MNKIKQIAIGTYDIATSEGLVVIGDFKLTDNGIWVGEDDKYAVIDGPLPKTRIYETKITCYADTWEIAEENCLEAAIKWHNARIQQIKLQMLENNDD